MLKSPFAVLLLLLGMSVSAQLAHSPVGKKKVPPKYWMAYEYCFTTDLPLPEERWLANIDWVDANFKAFGYDMVSTDGWIETAQTINADGFITKYNDHWKNDFFYYADYLKKRDMTLGIYYNPMWLTKAAFDQNIPVKGTAVLAKDIVGQTWFNDRLYWVDTEKPGAKEWIQGYVAYFISTGATFLRIDFLENYERNYGKAKYDQALRWIKEAAGDKIMLSLVMPNCYGHCETELKYGDMIRIDDDCFKGGWDFLSARRRGERKTDWPQYGNAFDGFVAFSDLGDRILLDGDFMRLNTLASDAERRFQISLFTMGGSPISISDQYDTIGAHAWAYQNKELIALTDAGFVARPLSQDLTNSHDSSIWIGKLDNGDWIVGLFNREDTPQKRTIDLKKHLGLKGKATIRDLWRHTEAKSKANEYTTTLDPHDCRVIRISTM